MANNRVILHCDCNSFYASVESVLHPEYHDVPMAVGGSEEDRHGIILAKNEKAKMFGVKTAETIWQAKKKCPELLIVPPHHSLYLQYSDRINEIYSRFTDRVEPFSIDESWLDVTASGRLFGDGKTIADTLRRLIRQEVGVTVSVGVSFNKIFAKMGSDYKKPDATTVITRENYKQILYPLPVSDMIFVGQTTAASLKKLGIRTIGDLAAIPRQTLVARFGKMGDTLYEYANGLENSEVSFWGQESEIKSVGNSITFRRNLVGEADIRHGITALADSVAARLRKHKLKGTVVQVTVKDADFKVLSRQRTLEVPTQLAMDIAQVSMDLIRSVWDMKKPVRLLGVTCSKLQEENAPQQVTLFEADDTASEKRLNAERAMDSVRQRHGKDAVSFGAALNDELYKKK